MARVIKRILVRATWDEKARMWLAESDDLPELATEAESLDALSAKLCIMIPEVLEANDRKPSGDVPFELLARQNVSARSSRR